MPTVDGYPVGRILTWPCCPVCKSALKQKVDGTYKPCYYHAESRTEHVDRQICRLCMRTGVTFKSPVYHGWHVCRACYDAEIAWWRRHGGLYFRENKETRP